MLRIHETTASNGALVPVLLGIRDGALVLAHGGDTLELPDGVLDAVMARYGAPFDPEAHIDEVGALELGEGRTLRHVRHLAGYDVIARDYVVYDAGDGAPLCAMATSVAGALEHLGRAAERARRLAP